MSEYQYYDFRALDDALGDDDLALLRQISSRASITSRRFTVTYHYSDLRAAPHNMLSRWFDAYLYISNWGSRYLSFRLPSALLTHDHIAPYASDMLDVAETRSHCCVHIRYDDIDGGGEWVDGEGLLAPLLPLRDALASGDHRMLYLAWLKAAESSLDDDADEPPVPAGLAELGSEHRAFIEFLSIDSDCVAAAALESAPLPTSRDRDALVRRWVATQAADKKDAWLTEFITSDVASVRHRLLREVLEGGLGSAPTQTERTVGELRELAHELREERVVRKRTAAAAEAQAEKERRAAEREEYLGGLLGQEDALWKQVDEDIEDRKAPCRPPGAYLPGGPSERGKANVTMQVRVVCGEGGEHAACFGEVEGVDEGCDVGCIAGAAGHWILLSLWANRWGA